MKFKLGITSLIVILSLQTNTIAESQNNITGSASDSANISVHIDRGRPKPKPPLTKVDCGCPADPYKGEKVTLDTCQKDVTLLPGQDAGICAEDYCLVKKKFDCALDGDGEYCGCIIHNTASNSDSGFFNPTQITEFGCNHLPPGLIGKSFYKKEISGSQKPEYRSCDTIKVTEANYNPFPIELGY